MGVSAVIPLYNKVSTIERTLNSVLNQSCVPDEIVVIDDGSTDGSNVVVAGLNIPGLRLIRQENAGVSAARNRGAIEARCEWLAYLDGDDEWMPDFLKTIADMQSRYPESDIYGTAYYAGDYLGDKHPISLNGIAFTADIGVMENYFQVASMSAPPLWSSAVCLRKKALLDIGGFPENVRSGEDLLTWARLAARKPPVYSMKPQAIFWQDKAHTYDESPNRVPEPDDPVGKALAELKNVPGTMVRDIDRYLSMWYKMRSSIYLRLGMRSSAFFEILKGLRSNPSNSKLYVYLLMCVLPAEYTRNLFKRFGR